MTVQTNVWLDYSGPLLYIWICLALCISLCVLNCICYDPDQIVEQIDVKNDCEIIEPEGWGENQGYKQMRDAKEVTYTKFRDGRRSLRIHHADVKGLKPADLIWFWKIIDRVVRCDTDGTLGRGPELLIYRLWHQRDHTRFVPMRTGEDPDHMMSKGATFGINESLLTKHDLGLDSSAHYIYQFDEENFGFTLGPNQWAAKWFPIANVDHWMKLTQNGDTDFVTQVMAGKRGMKWSWLNSTIVAKKASDSFLLDWSLHNIEESGETEKIIPKLQALGEENMIKLQDLRKREVRKPMLGSKKDTFKKV